MIPGLTYLSRSIKHNTSELHNIIFNDLVSYQVIDGKVFMGHGRTSVVYNKHFDIMFPHHQVNFHFISRMPRVVESNYSLLLPFSSLIWGMLVLISFSFSTMFLVSHIVYSRGRSYTKHLYHKEKSISNFYLFTYCKIAEPDPLPWFTHHWSTGKSLTMLWAIYSLLVTSFYNCNLRAYLSALKYEKTLDTVQDVIDNGQTPWIMSEMFELRYVLIYVYILLILH